MKEVNRQIIIGNSPNRFVLHYVVQYKKIKNVHLRIKPDCSVIVSAPDFVQIKTIEDFIIEKKDFVIKNIARFSQREEQSLGEKQFIDGETFIWLGKRKTLKILVSPNREETAFVDGDSLCIIVKKDDIKRKKKAYNLFVNRECTRVFTYYFERFYPFFKEYLHAMPKLTIKTMRSKWGCCVFAKEEIRMSKLLIEKPLPAIEYVVLHEFCHFVHHDHSKSFYNVLSKFMPDWKEHKKLLYTIL